MAKNSKKGRLKNKLIHIIHSAAKRFQSLNTFLEQYDRIRILKEKNIFTTILESLKRINFF